MALRKRDFLLVFLSSLLLTLSFPKFNLEFLVWVGLIPLLIGIRGKGPRDSFIISYLTGFLFFLGTLYWIVTVTTFNPLAPLGLLLLASYLALYFGCFGLLLTYIKPFTPLEGPVRKGGDENLPLNKWFGRGLKPLPNLLTGFTLFAPFLWVSLELIRSHLLTGFPWSLLGHSQYLNLPLIQISSFTGVYGVSFLIVMVNGVVFQCLLQISEKRNLKGILVKLLLVALVIGGCFAYGKHTLSKGIEGRRVKVALIQGNIPQKVKLDPESRYMIMDRYTELTKKVSGSELIVWPETSIPTPFCKSSWPWPSVLKLAKEKEVYLLVGSTSEADGGEHNSAFLITPEGEIGGRYHKIHLVPFGEYLPLVRFLPFLRKLLFPAGGFIPGKEYTILNTSPPAKAGVRRAGKERFGVLICFEGVFPNLVRNFIQRGADFMVNITNDAWFGRTSGPYQHASMLIFRAVENRRSFLRAANTGLSFFIDPLGRIEGKVCDEGGRDIFIDGYSTSEITLSEVKSFYSRFGDIFAYLCTFFCILQLLLFSRRRRG